MSSRKKVALVTGGGRGLGEAICVSLAKAGLHVVVGDINRNSADSVVQALRDVPVPGNGAYCTAEAVHLDVTDEGSCADTIATIAKHHGTLDVLINNAGVDETVSIEDLSVASWDLIMATNLRGPFLLSKHALKVMRESGSGYIINIASTAAKRAWPNASAYHASKWGVLGFTHALHTEARPLGIKVTAVVCGGMRTPFLLDRFPDINVETLQDPASVAETIKFLLTVPKETVIPEIMVLPMKETSWP